MTASRRKTVIVQQLRMPSIWFRCYSDALELLLTLGTTAHKACLFLSIGSAPVDVSSR